ncbi:nucleoside-diphosphate-sugar epimerase [Bacillus oleivorans]|uniref:Nucleoside-diphosphate-sugar epimerase n=1 Tax=Bacillus oleivorans TaxID=1448271 RepID=A0A285D7Z8_9BACI|nr:NAD-dependent epimerase/dehydratase family protein [Bacillus oleivorans]SNX75313.1 nucleoside-diphosphate-sugar epimerase [Bacillus oleivorans]
MKSVILTGASGFIGTELILDLKEEFNICAIGRNFEKYYNSVSYLTTDLNDIQSNELLSKLPNKNADIFIHAAGQAHIKQTENTKHLFKDNNVKATENALKIALELNTKIFIYISSIAVQTDDPNDIYGQSKKEAELLIMDYCKKHHMDYVIIRPVVVYGENDNKGNVAKLINQIRKGFFPLFNNGNTTKSMIYVKNLNYMIKKVIESKEYNNSILIARDKDELSLKTICIEIKKNIRKPVLLLPIPPIFVNLLITIIENFQKIGVVKSINTRSLRNLQLQTKYPLEGINKELVDNLPYSTFTGITNTILNKNR